MKRRRFLKSLGMLGVGLSWPRGSLRRGEKSKEQRTFLNRFSLAGFQYYDGPTLLERIKQGQELALAAEPDNPHDRFAVRATYGRHMLGYVPRSDNKHLSRLLRQGADLECKVTSVNPDQLPWQAVQVEVWLKSQS